MADLLDWVKDTLLLHLEQTAAAASNSDAKNSSFSSSSTKDMETESKAGGHPSASAGLGTSFIAPSKDDGVHGLAPSSAAQSKGGDTHGGASSKHSSNNHGVGDARDMLIEVEKEGEGEVSATSEVAQSAAQLQQDQRDRHLQQRQTRTARTSASGQEGKEGEDEGESDDRSLALKAGMHIPYSLEFLLTSSASRSATAVISTTSIPSVRLRYAVPHDL